jgi:shikimate dehydrogenase
MTSRYAVFGNPIGHSKSPAIFRAFARQTGEALAYDALLAPIDGFAAAIARFRAEGGNGCNVTIPFKVEACALATERSERARLAGAANWLRFDGGRILADNVDGIGLVRDLQQNLGVQLQGARVLILGGGGAVRGCVLPILEQRPAALVIANRTAEKAKAICAEIQAAIGARPALEAGGLDLLGDRSFDLVLNATAASLGGELPQVPASAFAEGCLAYDMVYGKKLTPFLKLAQVSGATRIADGVGMLVEQAAEGFLLWRGKRPATREVIASLLVPLE